MKIVFVQLRVNSQVPSFVVVKDDSGAFIKFEAATLAQVGAGGSVNPIFYANTQEREQLALAWKAFTAASKGGVSAVPALQSWWNFVRMRSWKIGAEIDFESDKQNDYFACLNDCFASPELLSDRDLILPVFVSFYSEAGPMQTMKQKAN